LLVLAFAAGLVAQDLSEPEGSPDLGDSCCLAGGFPRTVEQMLERRGVEFAKRSDDSSLDSIIKER